MREMNRKGLLLVVSGPSGCGKGTVLGEVFARQPDTYYSVSATTRSPRPGEVDGVQYHFLTKEEFEEKIAAGQMLEYAQYAGNYYGTPAQAVDEKLAQGKNVVLEIEVQGAKQVKLRRPDAVMIFIMPPSMKELRRRLTQRGTEAQEVVERRLETARQEMPQAKDYDYIVFNDTVEEAAQDVCAILRARHCLAGENLARLEQAVREE